MRIDAKGVLRDGVYYHDIDPYRIEALYEFVFGVSASFKGTYAEWILKHEYHMMLIWEESQRTLRYLRHRLRAMNIKNITNKTQMLACAYQY